MRGYELIAAANNVRLPAGIKPDTIWTYELGAKFSLPERRLAMEYAVYHSDWRDVAVRIPLGTSGANGVINSSGTTTNGVDASASYAVTSALRATLGAAFVDARYAGSVAGTGIRRGAAVDDVPRVTFSKGPSKVSLFGENLANDHRAVSIRTVAPLDASTTITEAYSPRLRPRTIGLALGFAFD